MFTTYHYLCFIRPDHYSSNQMRLKRISGEEANKTNLWDHREDPVPSAAHDNPGLSGAAIPGGCAGIPSPESECWFTGLN